MSRAVQVLTGKGCGNGMGVGDVVGKGLVQAIWLMVQEAVWLEDGEIMCGVRVLAQEQSKIQMRDGGPFGFGVKVGSALVTQFDCCQSGCTQFVFICSFWHHSYCFTNRGACM